MGSPRRLRVPPGALDDDRVAIAGDELHHVRVLRLAVGSRVRLFDGRGIEVEAEIVELRDDRAVADVRRRLDVDTEPRLALWLVQGLPARLATMDEVVRQAVEVGVFGILPVVAARTHLPSDRRGVLAGRVDRWRRIAVAAAKQCRRVRVPEVRDAVDWAALDWDRMPASRICVHPGIGGGADTPPAAAEAALLVGPEGGWSDAEVDEARRRGAVGLDLGARTLRCDTAAAVALAVVLRAAGDLG